MIKSNNSLINKKPINVKSININLELLNKCLDYNVNSVDEFLNVWKTCKDLHKLTTYYSMIALYRRLFREKIFFEKY